MLFPVMAVPVSLVAARRGHNGFVERLVSWFVIIPVALGAGGAFAVVVTSGLSLTLRVVGDPKHAGRVMAIAKR